MFEIKNSVGFVNINMDSLVYLTLGRTMGFDSKSMWGWFVNNNLNEVN